MPDAEAEPRLHFDRRAPELLLAGLAPGGPFHGLVELVTASEHRGMALDLQLRADPRRPTEGRATLYTGLTKAVDLGLRGESFRVVLQKQFGPAADWQVRPRWAEWLVISEFESVWPEALAAIRSTIATRPDRYVAREGAMQALLSNAASDRFVVIDRESMVGFDPGKKGPFLAPLREAMSAVVRDLELRGHRWAKVGRRFGDKLDALAVDADGRVLVIEVKPGTPTPSLGWSPAQVACYQWLFGAWARQDPAHACEVLSGMLAQRARLGLAPHGRLPPRAPARLVPVIAVCGSVRNTQVANERMLAVHDAVRRARVELDELEVWQVSDDGAIAMSRLGGLV